MNKTIKFPVFEKKALIFVFEDTAKEKTGIGENIPLSIEFDVTNVMPDKVMNTIKRSFKALNCVIITTEKTQAESVNLLNQVRKYSKLNKVYLREIKIGK